MIRKIISLFRKMVVFVFMAPSLKKIRKRFPKTYSFLARRFSIHKFSGMPSTLLFIAIVGNLVMMLDVYEDILNSKEFIAVDKSVAEFLFSMRTDFMAKFFYVVTQLGNQFVILGGMLLMSWFLITRKEGYAIISLVLSVAGSALTVQLGKRIFKISRPVEFSYYHMDSYSFPSGHATAAVAFYGIVFYLLIANAKKLRTKFIWLITGLSVILLIGFSRMYLCEHFLSDVLGGYLLGLLWLLFSLSVLLWKEDQLKRKRP